MTQIPDDWDAHDTKFVLRLIVSWTLYLAIWAMLIAIVVMAGLTTTILVGRGILNYLPIPRSSQLPALFDEGLFGCITIASVIISILGFKLLSEYLGGENGHYTRWLQTERAFIALRNYDNDYCQWDFEYLDPDGSRNFWQSIPEVAMMVIYWRRLFPLASLRRYLAIQSLKIIGFALVCLLMVYIVDRTGYWLIPERVMRQELEIFAKFGLSPSRIHLLTFVAGGAFYSIIALLGTLFWYTIIGSCRSEWLRYRQRRLAAAKKFN